MLQNNPQVISSLLNLHQSFNNLYELKFKGKKMVQQLANAFWERQQMLKQIKPSFSYTQNLIFKNAIANCTSFLTIKISDFEEEFLKKYIANFEIVQRNIDYLSSRKDGNGSILVDDYQFLLHELIELSQNLAKQYRNQQALIQKFWHIVTFQYFSMNKEPEQLKELILHIGFQTEIDSIMQETWKNKMFAVSNQRYNSRKT